MQAHHSAVATLSLQSCLPWTGCCETRTARLYEENLYPCSAQTVLAQWPVQGSDLRCDFIGYGFYLKVTFANDERLTRKGGAFDNASSDKSQVARILVVPCGLRSASVVNRLAITRITKITKTSTLLADYHVHRSNLYYILPPFLTLLLP